jgi:hypothetical protein
MFDIKKMIRQAIRESLTNRPYGIAYTGAMIENDHDWLRLYNEAEEQVKKFRIPVKGWNKPEDYHMTICLGELPLHRKMAGDLNSEIALHVTHFGMSQLAAAFKVTGYMSKNDVQHITMLFKNQPSDSKNITNWLPLDEPFEVTAVIREVPALRP